MNEVQELLSRFWIVREQDRELYYAVKRSLPQLRRFINEQLGWNLIVNEAVIKLEKVPPHSMAWMGIAEFTDPLDYALLCALLIYLEDKEEGEQFLLSALTAALETYMANACPVDWTRFPHRKALVRVLRFAQRIGLLLVYDGNSETFGSSREQEVLYENTGLSRDFSVHFGRDVSACQCGEDFEALAWEGDADRGRQRVNRVYRQLALTPGLYWSQMDQADYEYVKNQRQWLAKYLGEAIGGELQVHRNGAFLLMEQEHPFGSCFPNDQALSDVTLLLCRQLRAQVDLGEQSRQPDDRILCTRREFHRLLSQCREQWSDGWGRQLRELPLEQLEENVISYMEGWMLLERCDDALLLCPAAGKWTGQYPASYRPQEGGATIDEPLENA
ncbi:MAG: TIGR02678 family protein [Clostridia bacterium]